MNQSSKFQVPSSKFNGFTLVEILVAIAVLSIFGTLIVTTFSRTLTGTNKSQVISAIKQNGQAVMELMDKSVRNADYACVSNDKTRLIAIKNGVNTRFRFAPPSISPPSNGYIEQDNPVRQTDPSTGQNETDPVFVNRICQDSDQMINPVKLTEDNPRTGVSVNCPAVSGAVDCSANPVFKSMNTAGFPDQVVIKFDVWPGVDALKSVSGQIDAVTFQTTIQLR